MTKQFAQHTKTLLLGKVENEKKKCRRLCKREANFLFNEGFSFKANFADRHFSGLFIVCKTMN